MPELFIYPQSDLPADYHCQILTFLRVQWPDGFVGENRLRTWITAPRFHPLSFLLVEAGLLISHAQVVWKHLAHAGETYKIYGITGVFTFPSFQGQGYGAQVVGAATDFIAHSDADLGMFHCAPGLENFYASCGWLPIYSATTFIGSRSNPLKSDEILLARFLSDKGLSGRWSFEHEPLFFDEDSTW